MIPGVSSEKNALVEESCNEKEKRLLVDELREKLRDPKYLPSGREIIGAFPPGGDYYKARREWDEFCRDEQHPVFEFLNQEYIEALANYLEQRTKELKATRDESVIILEVGAGDGRLAHFLEQELNEKGLDVKMIATDNGEKGIKPVFPVERLNYKEALQKYKPTIVICSWMPLKQDWTADFRATQSVEEYLLIGEVDMGCCGDKWFTWGRAWLPGHEGKTPPYEAESFERRDLSEFSKLQICRTDRPGYYGLSYTVSFRRQK